MTIFNIIRWAAGLMCSGNPSRDCVRKHDIKVSKKNTVNNYMQVTGMVTGENFAFFIYRHFVEIL